MKKIIIAIFTVCLLLTTGCQKKENNEGNSSLDLTSLMTEIRENQDLNVPQSMDLTKEDFCLAYGIDESMVDEVVASKAMISAQMAEIIMVKVSEGTKTSDVLAKIDESYAQMMLYPSHMELVEQKVVIENGDYLFVVAAEKANDIKAVIEAALQ